MNDIIDYLLSGLIHGYNQNFVLKTEYNTNKDDIVEYLLTVNVAQKLIDWNEVNNWDYSINLEYDVLEFLKNAFLPYMIVDKEKYDTEIILPQIDDFIKGELEVDKGERLVRHGEIDIGIRRESLKYLNFKESIAGIELKGINPTTGSIVADVIRLVKIMEIKDDSIKNSVDKCYFLHIRKFGGNIRLSKKASLEKARKKSLLELEKSINQCINPQNMEVSLHTKEIRLTHIEGLRNHPFNSEFSSNEVGEMTKLLYSVVIEVLRK